MRLIQGTEHEYTLFCRKMDSRGVDPHQVALELLRKSDLHCAGEFMSNQSRAYLDCGHLEISTCEVSNFMDMVRWEKAGEKIVDWLRKKAEQLYLDDSRIRAYKNNTAPDGTSYGSHENYCVDRKVQFPERYAAELGPHLVTRFIYTGAGDIIDGRYVLSPSAYLTAMMVSGDTMHDTGVINTRDEALAGERFRRLHVQVGDALMNETAIMLRHFTTSHVIKLMELDMLEDAPQMASPLEDLWHNVEQTNPDKWKVTLKGGKVVSPVDIQEYYLGKLEAVAGDGDSKRALKTLEGVLGGLREKRTKDCARRVEWLDRYLAIGKEKEAAGDDPDIEMKACKRYSEIGEERGIYYRRQREGLVDRVLSDKDILDAVRNPPGDTRAHLRGALCEKGGVEYISWDTVVLMKGDKRKKFVLEDPYESGPDGAKEA